MAFIEYNPLICEKCREMKPIENRDLGLCASCNKIVRSQKNENVELYYEVRERFLLMAWKNNWTCPITGHPITIHSDVHHKMGRTGYADDNKRRDGIMLLYDVEFFLAVSRVGHKYIEEHPEEAYEMGWSIKRLTKK